MRAAPGSHPAAPGGLRVLVLALGALLAAAPATGAQPAWYTVRPGDSLSLVAQRLGVTLGSLRRDNGIAGSLLRPGQRLRVNEPLRGLRERDVRWRRPFAGSAGRVLRDFGPRRTSARVSVPHTGVDVSLPQGSEVRAPATGVVRYCGPQEGFGTVVILEHGAGWTTVLAPLAPDTTRCRTGEVVLRGDFIGRTGPPREGPEPYIHVELRRHREAVNPARLLR